MTPAVRLVDVTKSFGALQAVRSLSLDIEEGEFLTLLGPSGCGKTTTLRLVSGFETPDAGTIAIAGALVNHLPAFRRNVNTVFQSYALFPHMTVFENVAYGLSLKRVDKATIRRRVGEMLERVGLPEKAQSLPRQLSGGQMQRIALARALINEPRVLLLDEPLGALDAKLRKQMQVELKQVHRNLGITFIYVTHDQEEALAMSDRIAVMSDGRIMQLDTPDAVFERPNTRFVADFVGASNFLTATAGTGGTLNLPGGLALQSAFETPSAPGSTVAFAIRPQKVRLLADAGDGLSNRVPATVREVIYVGAWIRVLAELPGGTLLTLEDLPDRMPVDYRALQPGQAVTLRLPPEALLRFEA
jgi:spermidine/putrescine transport system ATP-binding protein